MPQKGEAEAEGVQRRGDMAECLNCGRQVDAGVGDRRDPRCPECRSRKIVAEESKEMEVRRHLYGRGLSTVRVAGPEGDSK